MVGHYTGHIKCVEAFLKLGLDRKVNILDLACGTGLLGLEVKKIKGNTVGDSTQGWETAKCVLFEIVLKSTRQKF